MAKNIRRPDAGFVFSFSFKDKIQMSNEKYYEISFYNLINNYGCQDPNSAYFDVTISDSNNIKQKLFDSNEFYDYNNGEYNYDRWNDATFCFRINSNEYIVILIFF